MIVKYTHVKDIEETLEQFRDVLPSLSQGISFRKKIAEKFSKYGKVIGVTTDTRLIGFAAFYCNDFSDRKGYLSMIAVKPDVQGMGYGKALLTNVEHIVRCNGMFLLQLEVAKENFSAISFYRVNGYFPVEERKKSVIYQKILEKGENTQSG